MKHIKVIRLHANLFFKELFQVKKSNARASFFNLHDVKLLNNFENAKGKASAGKKLSPLKHLDHTRIHEHFYDRISFPSAKV